MEDAKLAVLKETPPALIVTGKVFSYIFMAGAVIVALFPILWVVLN